MKKIFGFTLAEVLITLGIIGVVAALTIPTLMANYQKQVWINKLKKTYSVLNEGYKQIMVNQGCTDMICTGFMPDDVVLNFDNEEAKNKFITTFKLTNVNSAQWDYAIKKGDDLCGSNATFSGCIGTGGTYGISGSTADGAIIAFGAHVFAGGLVLVDTNASRGPNEFGRDIFVFAYTDKMITPFYSKAHLDWVAANSSGSITNSEDERKQAVEQGCSADSGLACAEKIIMDGWQMNY